MKINPSTATRLKDIRKGLYESSKKRSKPSKKLPIKPCKICNKEFAWTTLEKYGGSICGKCFKSKTCKCKICDVEKKVSEMVIDGQESFCRTCYIPTVLSYSIYVILFIYLFVQNFTTFVVVLVLFFASIWFLASQNINVYEKFKKVYNYTIRPTNIRKSSIFIVFLASLMLCSLALTLVNPWFVCTVTYEHAYNNNSEWADYQGEAFTHEYYLDYMEVDIKNPDRWMDNYRYYSDIDEYPWYYNNTYDTFNIYYADNEDSFEHRQSISSTTQILGFISIVGYALSVLTSFIFYRMTTNLEPNFLYLKNQEKFQSQVNSFAKKLANMKKKGIIVSSLNPYLDKLGKIYTSKADDISVSNPLKILNLMIVCTVVAVSFSVSAILFYWLNWYEALRDDGVILWNVDVINHYPYYFTGNYNISPMVISLCFSITVGLLLIASHAIFLRRSSYNMVAEIIDSSSRTSDFKIPSELLNNIEEPLPVEEEVLTEVVEAEPESVDGEN